MVKTNVVSIGYYIPTLGIILFALFYVYSTTLYPGGSQADFNSKGFDWINNYWCNMFNLKAMNGQPNPARPFAVASMLILWVSLLLFFYMFAEILLPGKIWKRIVQISATCSLIFASLLFTSLHDFATTFASILGLFAITGVIVGVTKSKLNFFKLTGILCIILLVTNNYIYYSKQFIYLLPLIQKITFLFVLLWIIGLNYKMIQIKSGH